MDHHAEKWVNLQVCSARFLVFFSAPPDAQSTSIQDGGETVYWGAEFEDVDGVHTVFDGAKVSPPLELQVAENTTTLITLC